MLRYDTLAALAAASLCAPALGGAPVIQLDQFATGYSSNNTPLLIPSIDPAGVGFHAPTGHLFIVDSEIEEVSAVWSVIHKNVFEVSLSGNTLYKAYDLTLFNDKEPTGITFNTADGFFYVSNDDSQRVTRYAWSAGGGFSAAGFVSTLAAGSTDPEDLTCDPETGRIFVIDGHDELIVIYHYQSGFVLDDVLDLHVLNASAHVPHDPEGIVFDPCSGHLFLVSTPDDAIWEFTAEGQFVNEYSLAGLLPSDIAPQGLALAPTSSSGDDPGALAIYIADGGIDNGQSSSERDGRIYEIAALCESGAFTDCNANGIDDAVNISSGTSADCNGNGVPDECDGGCVTGGTLLVSFTGSTTLAGAGTLANEDIAARNLATGAWSLYFDGSDVAVGSFTIDALARLPGGDLLLSFTSGGTIGAINADDSDILRFHPTSLGANTAGTWSMYFDGSDVGLTNDAENIDALAVLPDGHLVISTTDSPSVSGLSGLKDEDLLVFTPTSLGANTAGTWAIYFDGSDVGLGESSNEDVNGAAIAPDGHILLSTTGSFAAPGLAGADEDVFSFAALSLGNNTAGTYAAFFIGIAAGVPSDADVGAVELLP